MERNGALIRELVLDKSANFYVAGNSKMMPTQVREALVNAIKVRFFYIVSLPL